MKITFYGHACFGIETGGYHLLVDPFITGNGQASHIDVDGIPADFILLTHGHGDHVLDAERIARRTGALIISNFEIVSWYGEKGLTNGHGMNHGGEFGFDFGRLKYVSAVHSSVLPDGTYGGNPGGFIIKAEGKNVYIAWDTALTMDMKLIGAYDRPHVAILPIGDNFTMGIRDAAICADFIQCNTIIARYQHDLS